jgi:hypothetical protein
MINTVWAREPNIPTAAGLLEVGVEVAERQVAAESRTDVMFGFDDEGKIIFSANLNCNVWPVPPRRIEIFHMPRGLRATGARVEVFIYATDGETDVGYCGNVVEGKFQPDADATESWFSEYGEPLAARSTGWPSRLTS